MENTKYYKNKTKKLTKNSLSSIPNFSGHNPKFSQYIAYTFKTV